MFRCIQLCPPVMLPVLRDFRHSWQRLEVDRVRTKDKGLTMASAQILYTLCCLLDPPEDLPENKAEAAAVLKGRLCSPWTSVLGLDALGAFTDD